MKMLLNRCLSLLLISMLFLSLMPAGPVAAVTEETEVYYGEAYKDLKSDELRRAYILVEEGIASLSPRITFQGIVQINYKQMQDVLRAVCVDHPQYFWFLEIGSYVHEDVNDGGNIITFDPTYILDGEKVAVGSQELADAMYAFHTKVQEIIRSIPVNLTTEYEIALYLHDYLAENVTYTLEGEHPSAYAALIHGEAACYGYSKAYQCLLNAAGIRARTITGTCPDENGKLSGHAWNQLWLDGKCYYADVTWDDQGELIHHAYFATSLQEMSQEHFADAEFILPECNHDSINYHAVNAGNGVAQWSSNTKSEVAASCFQYAGIGEDGTVFVCEVRYKDTGFLSWLRKYYWDILRDIGVGSRAEMYYFSMQDVYYLFVIDPDYQIESAVVTEITIETPSVTLTGSDSCFQLQPSVQANVPWMPKLHYQSSDETVAIVDDAGIITAVSEGEAVVTISSLDGSVSAICTVTVDPAPEHIHTMRLFTSKQPTCIQDGYETHNLCTGCGIRFADETGAQPLQKTVDFIFPATGHLDYSWDTRFNYHIYKCACGYEKPNTWGNHKDADGDGNCDICQAMMPSMDPGASSGQHTTGNSQQQKALPGWVIPTIAAISVVLALIVYLSIRRRRKY